MTDKTLLVTGGSRGIGAATSIQAARLGYAVAVNYRRNEAAAASIVDTIEREGGRAIAVAADVGVEAEVVAMFDTVTDRLGTPRALVNSAGIGGRYMTIVDIDVRELERILRINVIGTMLCCREAARRMSRDRGANGGSIVNVSSMASTTGGRPGACVYASTKAAIDSFTIGFAKEIATQGVRVNAVRPGVTLTDMTDRVRRDTNVRHAVEASIAMQRVAEADEIAAPIIWLLSDEASFISGALLDASGGGFVISPSTEPPDQA